ncbi:MipA/OmpV family protein [Ferrovibrio sp.]|uniref:MipA/OmpV family protein n=1 Tax=Ferrovibrio sp. TaxID=1917215 RepID=UPI00261DD507|nr:MipA/OmpV family protein [Ferrovibrio sp.]
MKEFYSLTVLRTFAIAAGIVLALPAATLAQQPAAKSAAAPQSPADGKKDWDIRLGAGAFFQPDYEGSDDYEVAPLPLVSISYKDLVFLRGPSLGVNAFTWQGPRPTDKLQVGPLIRYQMGRDQDDSDDLRGMGNIDSGAELGLFLNYSTGPWSAGVTVFQDVSGAHDGLTAKFAGGYRHSFGPKLRARAELSTTWANDDYTETFFGVSALQAQRSGMRRYQAEGGVKDVGLTFDLDYSLTEHWGLTGRLGYKRLLGDAADSPLVEDRGSPDQLMTGLFLSYKF